MGRNRILLPAAFLFTAISSVFAQGNGIAGTTEATNMVTSYFDPGTKLVCVVGVMADLIRSIKVYSKLSSGGPGASKTTANWLGTCIFLIVAATILRFFFL